MLYRFDGIDASLDLVPLAARRALDHSGRKLTLAAWKALGLPERRALVALGARAEVDVDAARALLAQASPAPEVMAAVADPDALSAPPAVVAAFGESRPLEAPVWASLSPLERYALAKVAEKARPERLAGAYAEIVGASAISTHLAPGGGVRMVDVGAKAVTARRAEAESRLTMGAEAFGRLVRAEAPKGDVLGTARLAGIMAAKRTAELIPLCHPLPLTKIAVELTPLPEERAVLVRAAVETLGQTGVEMEALVAASVAALTVYDMLKAFDRAMVIGPTQLIAKSGGRSGDYHR